MTHIKWLRKETDESWAWLGRALALANRGGPPIYRVVQCIQGLQRMDLRLLLVTLRMTPWGMGIRRARWDGVGGVVEGEGTG